MRTISRRLPSQLHVMYLAGFLLNIAYAFLVYIESSYLETFIGKDYIGILFGVAAILGGTALLFLPALLRCRGQLFLMRLTILCTMLGILGMAFAYAAAQIVLSFILFYAAELLLWVLLDIYLQHASATATTGDTRGHYLTINSIAFAISPFLVGSIVAHLGYPPVYILSALLLLPLLFIFTAHIRSVPRNKFHQASPITGFERAWQDKNVLSIVSTNLLLEVFYCMMVIYTPIYLHAVLGMQWDKIGLIFSIMLLPFVLFELPLGKLADRMIGEQELLIVGLLIIAFATMALSFIQSTTVLAWAIALFATRTGASFVEIMNETYFFKHVKGSDADIISCYRIMRPLAYVVGPIVATIILLVLPMQYLFLVIGAVMLLGLFPAVKLQDTL